MRREPRLHLAVFDTPHRWAQNPQEALRIAVLVRALYDLDTLHARIKLQPRRWAARIELARLLAWFETDSEQWPYAFAALCGALDLPPAPIRAAVGQQPQTPIAKLPRPVVQEPAHRRSAMMRTLLAVLLPALALLTSALAVAADKPAPPPHPAAAADTAAAPLPTPAAFSSAEVRATIDDLVKRFNALEDERRQAVARLNTITQQQAELRGGIAALTRGFPAIDPPASAGDAPAPTPGAAP